MLVSFLVVTLGSFHFAEDRIGLWFTLSNTGNFLLSFETVDENLNFLDCYKTEIEYRLYSWHSKPSYSWHRAVPSVWRSPTFLLSYRLILYSKSVLGRNLHSELRSYGLTTRFLKVFLFHCCVLKRTVQLLLLFVLLFGGAPEWHSCYRLYLSGCSHQTKAQCFSWTKSLNCNYYIQ